jgi:two-component system, chemotaxis family, protein-glutamate methylesterase/glutaminase
VIRVLVVDDSASVRDLLVRLLRADGRFELVGTAGDGEEAVALVARLRPDVITMDVHMPRLGGLAAIRRIMADTPTPIVVVSAIVRDKDVALVIHALKAGALTVVATPHGPGDARHEIEAGELVTTIRLMSEVRVVRRSITDAHSEYHRTPRPLAEPVRAHGPRPLAIALAASTGGPQAIQTVLQTIGAGLEVPLFIVQHICAGFTAGMATWLSSTCPQRVKLAEHGEESCGGTVYLAPQDHHLMLSRRRMFILSSAPPMQGFRPSANVLFESVAHCYGAGAIGAILTGMGDDGAAGLGILRAAGATTIAQDEATSVVYGMPGAAIATGAAQHVLPLGAIGPALRRLVGGLDVAITTSTDGRQPSVLMPVRVLP